MRLIIDGVDLFFVLLLIPCVLLKDTGVKSSSHLIYIGNNAWDGKENKAFWIV